MLRMRTKSAMKKNEFVAKDSALQNLRAENVGSANSPILTFEYLFSYFSIVLPNKVPDISPVVFYFL
jgi:hypothetical protein